MVGRVRRALIAVAVAAFFSLPGVAAAQTAEPLAAQLQPPLPSPVVAGDWPDPDVSLIDGSYYAVATSGGWSPTFRILQSTDLRSWTIAGSVFGRPPAWAKDSFWAPELAALPAGGYALFYSAMPKRAWQKQRKPWYCLGVATAPSPLGPWRDLGRPLRCTPRGTIDPTPVVDGDELYLVYKEDGNAFRRPTPILLQELRADGRRLLGAPRELLRNQPRSWERNVIEAPFLVQRDGGWTMLYSGALCCSRDCAYAVGAARAPTLAGPWTRYPGNPILRSGNGWRCPGHVSVFGDHVAFHAYRSGRGILGGRQLHVAPLTWRPDGWPAIGDGRPLPPAAGGSTTAFDDTFVGPALAAEWEWPMTHPPNVRVTSGLELAAPRRSTVQLHPALAGREDAGVVSRRVSSSRFTFTAGIRLDTLRGRESAGVAFMRGGPFALGERAIGIVLGRPSDRALKSDLVASVWRRSPRSAEGFFSSVKLSGSVAHVRMAARDGRYRFAISSDGRRWRRVPGSGRSAVDETARVALTVGGQRGATVRFTRATLTEP
jgi:beta-xylosidase